MDKTTASYPRARVFSEFQPGRSQKRWHLIDSPKPAHSGSQQPLLPQPPWDLKDRQRGTTLFDQINAIRRAQHTTVPKPTEPKKVLKRLQRGPQASVTNSLARHHSDPNQPPASEQATKLQVATSSPSPRYGGRLPMEEPAMAQKNPAHIRSASTYSASHPTPSKSQHSTSSHHVRLPKEYNPYFRKMSSIPSRSEMQEDGDIHRDTQSRYTPHYRNFEDARELIGRRKLSSSIQGSSSTNSTGTCSPSNRPAVTYLAPPRSVSSGASVAPPKRKIVTVSPDTEKAGPSSETGARGSSDKSISLSKAGMRVVALDCEMIGCLEVNTPRALSSHLLGARTRKGKKRKAMFREISVAARCSIVDYSGTVLYDGYIMPKLKILNLRTRYSGITWKHLKTAVPFDAAKAEIAKLLEGCVVVGHALHNDTAALNITLPQTWIRDTSTYRPLREMAGLDPGQLPSLKNLAKALLGVRIQKGSHCSLEDARTTLELYKLVEQAWECIS